MTEKSSKNTTAEEQAKIQQETLKSMLEDLRYGELKKYKGAGKEYVKKALEITNLIEAYCISIQYTENIIEIYLDKSGHLSRDKDDKLIRSYHPIVEALYAKDIIGKLFYQKYIDTCQARNKIVHSITKREEMLKKFNNKNYRTFPLELMDLADDFFINNALKVTSGNKIELKQRYTKKIVDISIENLRSKNIKIDKSNVYKEIRKLLFPVFRKIQARKKKGN